MEFLRFSRLIKGGLGELGLEGAETSDGRDGRDFPSFQNLESLAGYRKLPPAAASCRQLPSQLPSQRWLAPLVPLALAGCHGRRPA